MRMTKQIKKNPTNSINDNQLDKTMTFTQTLATVMGTVIGAGVFFKAADVANITGHTSLHIFVWILAGFISLMAGLTGAEISAAIPETGGMIRYIDRCYGRFASFLIGWVQFIIYFPANIAALGIIFSTQLINLFHLPSGWLIPIAIASIVSILGINFLGAKVSGSFQSITTIGKLIPIGAIIIFGLLSEGQVDVSLFPVEAGSSNNGFLAALAAGLLSSMFAYDGWIHVGNVAGEMKNPRKDLPKAITFGMLGIMLVNVLVNYAYLNALPIDQIAGNETASLQVANYYFGDMGGKIITIGILVSVYGTINGYTMTGIRIPYTMGTYKLLPFSDKFAALNSNKVPVLGGVIQIIIAIGMIFMGGFNMLTNMLIFVIWIFYTLVFAAVIKLRNDEPDLQRPYKVPFYPVVPIIAILGGLFILIMTLITQFDLVVIGILMTALGVPVYIWARKTEKDD